MHHRSLFLKLFILVGRRSRNNVRRPYLLLLQLYSESKKIPDIFFPNGWEFLVQILHAYYTFISTLDYKFLLLARYVPNVAKRSIWDQCKKKYMLTTNRPTNLTYGKISNGHISARDRPIHFMFGSTLGFSRSADRMALIPVWPNSIGL